MSLAPKALPTPIENRVRQRLGSAFIVRALIGIAAVAILIGVFAYLKDRPLKGEIGTAAERPPAIGGTLNGEQPKAQPAPQPPPPVKLTPADIAAKYADAVVVLNNYDDQGQMASQGSGFICSPDGLVLTNYHVIRGASRMAARAHDQSTHEIEYVAGFDPQHDLAGDSGGT
jgi:S1-C subfamily serine protease